LGDRLEVAAGQTSVGDEVFGQDQHVATLFGQPVVVHGQPAADVRQPVFLGLMVMPSASEAISRTISP
jgi:hypothetical protein